MEQMNIDPSMIVQVEYSGAAEALKPTVFVEGDSYCCLLGPDPQDGIFGCGSTPDEALNDWEEHLKERLRSASDDDYVVDYIQEVIAEKKKGVAKDVQAFYDQFRPKEK